jgi:hypothetical protein
MWEVAALASSRYMPEQTDKTMKNLSEQQLYGNKIEPSTSRTHILMTVKVMFTLLLFKNHVMKMYGEVEI